MTGDPSPPTMRGMPEQYPNPIGARTARQEHAQIILSVPKALCHNWRLRAGDVVYWTEIGPTHAMLSVVAKPIPPTFEELLNGEHANAPIIGP